MAQTVSQYMLDRLHQWGVDRIFGYAGDGINGITTALRKDDGEHIRFIQTRHEELAAFEACAHAKFTDTVGVCLATSGPGAIHLLNGLYDAKKDHTPVVAIVGQQARMSLGGDYQQEVDLTGLFKDVADYVHMVSDPAQMRTLVDRSMRIARAERTVCAIVVPNDVQEMDAVPSPPRTHGAVMTGVGYNHPRVVPERADLEAAAEILNEGDKVAILIGAGARNAADEVGQVAERLGTGVAKALLGKDVLPDDLPWVTGSIGLLGTKPSYEMMENCDTLLMIGTSFPYSEWLPKDGKVKAVQIDIKARMLGLRYPTDVNLHGDAKQTLQELIPMLVRKEDRKWREKIEDEVREWWKVLEERANYEADPINPQKVFWELSPRLPENAIITCDSGSSANWYARDLKIRKGMRASLSGGLATMCPGVPYAIAAKFAYPDRVVVAVVGDGAMQMLGNNGMITIADNWRKWDDPRLVVLVLNNRDLNQVTWEQRVMEGDAKYKSSQVLPEFNYANYAKGLGLEGIEVTDPDRLAGAFDYAFTADRPVIVDAHTDPEVPPIPPHIRFEQARGMYSSLLRDSDRGKMIARTAKEMVSTVKGKLKS